MGIRKFLFMVKTIEYINLFWLLVNGILTTLENGLEIDHRDRNPCNNKLTNLRLTNKKGNSQNRNLLLSNKSNITGVKQDNKWLAIICINYKDI